MVSKKQTTLYLFLKHYKTNRCLSCAALAKCTLNKKGRLIERSEYQPYFEQNKKNIEANPLVYKKRQSIIEHNYGILKRQWGFYYISTKKGINRAGTDVGLMFCAYNLRRIINLVDKNLLKKFLEELWLSFFGKIVFLKDIVRSFFGAMIFTRTSLIQIA
ncbi:MAG TPA: transposase [Chitinophagaceae bacterium]|nr:transposase [Chitinophagaceae bacterium]